jgi:membrane protease YdiL (CAAX protease family)
VTAWPVPGEAAWGGRRLPMLAGCAGLAGAVAIRVGVAGQDGARSPVAGLTFGAALVVLSAVLGFRLSPPRPRGLVLGLAGGVALCLGPLIGRFAGRVGEGAPAIAAGLLPWAAVVATVAVAEEMLLRGALFEAVESWRGSDAAVLVTSVAFAAMHVPVYGVHVVPLDFAVGAGLGALRVWSGGVAAPAVAHVVADMAGWWLR